MNVNTVDRRELNMQGTSPGLPEVEEAHAFSLNPYTFFLSEDLVYVHHNMGTEWRYQNIAYHDLEELPKDLIEKTAKHVEELDLTANRISDLRFLIEYQRLESLVLDHNAVSSHVNMPDMPCLHTLWLNNNRIDNLSVFVSTLAKTCPNLRYFSMMNNKAAPSYFNNGTFQQYMDYRYFVISRLPRLEVLDDKKIEKTERSEAERIYKPVRKRAKKKQTTTE